MELDKLTIGEAKQLASLFSTSKPSDDAHWEIGKNYLIRTVTMIQTGRLVKVTDKELVIDDAAWIADTGRFSDALKNDEYEEVEPFFSPVIVGRGAIIDAVQIKKLPRSQK